VFTSSVETNEERRYSTNDASRTIKDFIEDNEALKEWLIVLTKTLPINWEIHKVLNDLLKDFNYISKHEAYMISALNQHPPATKGWSESCSRGIPDEGFTCGLWELFHAMTVGAVDFNNNVHERRRLSTEKVGHTLRDFIENFFQCSECRANFLMAYDSCKHDRCRRLSTDVNGLAREKISAWAQLPLWLFETHNGVNIRLMKEKAAREGRETTRDDEIEVMWPPRSECLPCWNEDKTTGQMTPNHTIVYKWLQLEYGQRDENTPALHMELTQLQISAKRKLNRRHATISITQSSVAAGLLIAVVAGSRLRRRRVTGLHKKFEETNFVPATKRKFFPGSKRNLAA
jgi:Erv1 / Alr family